MQLAGNYSRESTVVKGTTSFVSAKCQWLTYDSEQSPFTDDVPDMQADVQAILWARIQAPATAGDTS